MSSSFTFSFFSLQAKMSYVYYALAALLVIFSVYRPFITKLDKAKYSALGGASFLAPYVIDYHNKVPSIAAVYSSSSNNMTSILNLVHNFNADNAASFATSSTNTTQSLFFDAVVLFMLTAFVVSICGLFTRWHFPTTFIKPYSNSLVSGFFRHGLSISLILLAITRYKLLYPLINSLCLINHSITASMLLFNPCLLH